MCDVRHEQKSKHKSSLKLTFHLICFTLHVFFKNLPETNRLLCLKSAKVHSRSHEWFRQALPLLSTIQEHSEPWALPGRMPYVAWIQAAELLLRVCRATKIFFLCSSDLKAPKNMLHILIHYFSNFCKLKKSEKINVWFFFFNNLKHYNFVTLHGRRCWVPSFSCHSCPESTEVQDFILQ